MLSIKVPGFHRSLQGSKIQDLSKIGRLYRGFHCHKRSKIGRCGIFVQDIVHLSIEHCCGLLPALFSSLPFANRSLVLSAVTHSILKKSIEISFPEGVEGNELKVVRDAASQAIQSNLQAQIIWRRRRFVLRI